MIQTITPIDNTVYVEREYNSKIIEETISNSLAAQKEWASLKVEERVKLLKKFVSDFLSKEKQILEEITRQMGRPISQASSELKGFKEIADYMLSIAEALPVSEPVPAVVGTAIIGAIFFSFALFQ